MKRNSNLSKLQSGYLFSEINRRKKEFLEKHPEAKIISLGIGNTTEPLLPHITNALKEASFNMGNFKGYSGYGDEQGFQELRRKISDVFYKGLISPEEVFVSDGAKCDIGRLQIMFGSHVKIAVQDPAYPVYVDGSVIVGATGNSNQGKFEGIVYMPCNPENNFFPYLNKLPKVDLIYFCSPNNPTGAVSTKQQLKELVDFSKKNNSILIFDAAYSEYITDEKLPRSIFEIEDSKNVAIEINSFSKSIGFTGVRLGWTVVPKNLKYDDGSLVINDFNKIVTTLFNGASNIVQYGGIAALDQEGLKEMKKTVDYYKGNAKIIVELLNEFGIKYYGGINSPYIWVRLNNKNSWEIFDELLENANLIVTPGSGFGPSGEGFIRISAFVHRENVEEAAKRLRNYFSKN